jgi:hypothetical protein
MNDTAEKLEDNIEESNEVVDKADFEVEIVDDTPEEDRVAKRKDEVTTEAKEVEDSDDGEAKNYSQNVQKRISQLKYEFHEERRAKEEAARLREEAVKFAETLKKDNEHLRKTLAEGENMLIDQAKGRVGAELERAKKDYKEAYESGDPDKLVEAQEVLSKLHNEKFRVDEYKPQPQLETPQQKPVQPPPPRLSQRGIDWQKENDWFDKDMRMTGYALGLHEELKRKGIVPDSEEYYKGIDEEMRKVFPEKFETEQEAPQLQNGTVVAPVERSGKKSRTVRLTRTQVALAKRLGLSPEQYAAQLMKEQSNG